MPLAELPDATTLAKLISNVTTTMCGIAFMPTAGTDRGRNLLWRIAALPIPGGRPIRVSLSSSREGCTALGAALFSMEPASLDDGMINDSLCELLNMAAGQIKSALALDQALGLPRIISGAELPAKTEAAMREGVVMRSGGDLGLLIWISEGLD